MFNPLACKYGQLTLYQKYFVTTVTCISMIFLYGCRHALPACVPHIAYIPRPRARARQRDDICESALYPEEPQEMINEIYLEWTQSQQHLVFSSFYIGYAISHIPTGVLCDMYGAKYFLAFGMLGCGLVCALTPFVLTTSPWFYSALVQGLMGVVQGIAITAIMCLLAHWVPPEHSTSLISYGYSGGCLGTMLSGILSLYFIKRQFYWKGLFHMWSIANGVWFVFIIIFLFSRPAVHPFMDRKEKAVMVKEMGTSMPRKIPWRGILHDSAVWSIVAGQLGHSYLIFTLNTHLPEFFSRVIGVDLKANMAVFVIPHLCQFASTLITSYMAEKIIKHRFVPLIYMRCICVAVGNILSAFMVLLSTYMGCQKSPVILCFALAMICKGVVFAGLKCNLVDISRRYAGVLQGLQNGLPSVVGILIPQIVSRICLLQTIDEWRKVFWFAFAFCSFSSVYYFIFCKGARAKWDTINEEDERLERIVKKT